MMQREIPRHDYATLRYVAPQPTPTRPHHPDVKPHTQRTSVWHHSRTPQAADTNLHGSGPRQAERK
jgi:hypothetical protein